jgi:hypothetical protein
MPKLLLCDFDCDIQIQMQLSDLEGHIQIPICQTMTSNQNHLTLTTIFELRIHVVCTVTEFQLPGPNCNVQIPNLIYTMRCNLIS